MQAQRVTERAATAGSGGASQWLAAAAAAGCKSGPTLPACPCPTAGSGPPAPATRQPPPARPAATCHGAPPRRSSTAAQQIATPTLHARSRRAARCCNPHRCAPLPARRRAAFTINALLPVNTTGPDPVNCAAAAPPLNTSRLSYQERVDLFCHAPNFYGGCSEEPAAPSAWPGPPQGPAPLLQPPQPRR